MEAAILPPKREEKKAIAAINRPSKINSVGCTSDAIEES
jgi:hypothetical protein